MTSNNISDVNTSSGNIVAVPNAVAADVSVIHAAGVFATPDVLTVFSIPNAAAGVSTHQPRKISRSFETPVSDEVVHIACLNLNSWSYFFDFWSKRSVLT